MNTDKIYAESVANQYSHKEESKVIALKKLDRTAKLPSEIFTYTFGMASALVLGVGMCLAMGVIGGGTQASFVSGIIIGLAGILGVCINYPLYIRIRKNGMDKYAGDIMRLANEISGKTEKMQ